MPPRSRTRCGRSRRSSSSTTGGTLSRPVSRTGPRSLAAAGPPASASGNVAPVVSTATGAPAGWLALEMATAVEKRSGPASRRTSGPAEAGGAAETSAVASVATTATRRERRRATRGWCTCRSCCRSSCSEGLSPAGRPASHRPVVRGAVGPGRGVRGPAGPARTAPDPTGTGPYKSAAGDPCVSARRRPARRRSGPSPVRCGDRHGCSSASSSAAAALLITSTSPASTPSIPKPCT